MKPTKRKAVRSAGRFKMTTLLASFALILAIGVGTTAAFLATTTDSVPNAFEPSKVEVSLSENFDGEKKSNITFSNEVDIPVFVRATLAVWWTDADGSIVSQPEGCSWSGGDVATGWTQIKDDAKGSDVYYYNKALEPKGQAGDLTTAMLSPIEAVIPDGSGCKLNVEVLYEAIQAEPVSVVQDAWGVSISGGNVTVVSGS